MATAFNSSDFFDDDFFKESVTVAGQVVDAVAEEQPPQLDQGALTRRQDVWVRLWFLKADFTGTPARHTTVVRNSASWTVDTVLDDGDCWELELINKGVALKNAW